MLDRPALGIARAIIKPGNPGMGDRAGAHRTGLERHPEIAVGQAIITYCFGSSANRQHLGMCGRVMEGARRIGGNRENLAVENDSRPDRYFPGSGGLGGGIERSAHRGRDRKHSPYCRSNAARASPDGVLMLAGFAY